MNVKKRFIVGIICIIMFLFGVWAGILCNSDKGYVTYENPAYVHIYSKNHGDIKYEINYSNGKGESPSRVLVHPDKIIVFTKNGEFICEDYLTFEIIRGVDEVYDLENKKG